MMPLKASVRLDVLQEQELNLEQRSVVTVLSDALFQTDIHLQISRQGVTMNVCVNADELRRAIDSVTR